VVGHAEVERALELHVEAGRVLDRLPIENLYASSGPVMWLPMM
jgi:hypothetical protein